MEIMSDTALHVNDLWRGFSVCSLVIAFRLFSIVIFIVIQEIQADRTALARRKICVSYFLGTCGFHECYNLLEIEETVSLNKPSSIVHNINFFSSVNKVGEEVGVGVDLTPVRGGVRLQAIALASESKIRL